MNKINVVMGIEGGFAREDAGRPYVIGAYSNPKTAEQIRLLASGGAQIQTVEINAIHPGHRKSAEQMGFDLAEPVRWEDIQKQLFERYFGIAQNNRDQLVSRLGVELYNRVVKMCEYVPGQIEQMTEDKANRWLGFVQGLLVAAGALNIDAERNFTRPLFHKLYGTCSSHEV